MHYTRVSTWVMSWISKVQIANNPFLVFLPIYYIFQILLLHFLQYNTNFMATLAMQSEELINIYSTEPTKGTVFILTSILALNGQEICFGFPQREGLTDKSESRRQVIRGP